MNVSANFKMNPLSGLSRTAWKPQQFGRREKKMNRRWADKPISMSEASPNSVSQEGSTTILLYADEHKYAPAGITLGMGSANERWRYIVTSSLIGWTQTQNDQISVQEQKGPTKGILAYDAITMRPYKQQPWNFTGNMKFV